MSDVSAATDQNRSIQPDVRAAGEHVYDVTLTSPDGHPTEHRFEIPTALLDEWGLGLTDEPPLARAAIELLQAHNGSLPAQFSITDPAVTYDGFLEQLQLTLTD